MAVRRFLSRQWQADGFSPIGLKPIGLGGRLRDIARKTPLFLDSPSTLAVFTLIDLYGMPQLQRQPDDLLGDSVRKAKQWLRDQVCHPRFEDFIPHLCVHETEAWILAEGTALGKRLRDPSIKPDPNAESRDLGNPPSRRISELFQSRRSDRYHKILDGGALLSAMQFEPVYSRCEYFRTFYDDLRKVARTVGP